MSDDLTLVIGSQQISGWTSIRVSRGVERCPSDFEIEATERFPGVSDIEILPGSPCTVLLGSDIVISGYIDRIRPRIRKNEHAVIISGRGKCQDLVDCSVYQSGFQYLNMHVLDIAKQMAAEVGVNVSLAPGADQGDVIEQLNVIMGETPYDVIERICRFRAMLLYEDTDGSLILSNVTNRVSAASGFQEGINVEEAEGVYAMDGRFSTYVAVQMGLDVWRDVGDGGNLIAIETDPGVPRNRPKVIIAEGVYGGQVLAAERAKWEKARRAGRGFAVRLTTDGWRDSAGALYEPNTLVTLDIPSLKLNGKTWVIADITYTKSMQGTKAMLTCMPPNAFNPAPVILNPLAPILAS
ncbi:phage baseplate assembly protein [Paraburkholderia fungorum]|uniref:phage baseplate assembly protein n=1 Tax=Paraburkholderia fungorum TaxID=134537 RepID=UPI003877E9A5